MCKLWYKKKDCEDNNSKVRRVKTMKKMCIVALTAVIIIIFVIAFYNLRDTSKEVTEGILVENHLGWEYA